MTERERQTTFGSTLRTIRTEIGVTQTEVVGFNRHQIESFERRGTAPTSVQVVQLGSSLRLDPEIVVFLEELAEPLREEKRERREQVRKKLFHVREQEATEHLQRIILSGRKPPSFASLGREHSMATTTVIAITRRAGLYDQIIEAKDRVNDVFVPSKDTAWVLGTLCASKGSVDPSKAEISYNAKDRSLVKEFKGICERLFSDGDKKKRAYKRENKKTTTVAFYDKNAVEALGDFSQKALARTMRTKHKWVFEELYKKSFISGLYDSGAIFDKRHNSILFATSVESVAKFWRDILTDINVKSDIEPHYERGIAGVIIRKQAEVKKLASYVESRSPDTRRQLEELQGLEKQKRRMAKPESVAQIYAEWVRLKARNKGKPMPTYKIDALYATGDTLFPHSVFTNYFGETPGEPETTKKFSVATRRLDDELGVLDPEELERVLSEMSVNPDQKIATMEEVIAEGKELCLRGILTINAIRDEFHQGRTKYEPRIYMRYLGVEGDNSPSWRVARKQLMRLAFPEDHTESSDTQIYP